MPTSLAKRRISKYYGARKRSRSSAMVLYRSPRSEMKHHVLVPTYNSAVAGSYALNAIPQNTTSQGRVGTKVKIWNIEHCVCGATSVSIRMDIVHYQSSAVAAPSNGFDQPVDRDKYNIIKTVMLHSGTLHNSLGYYGHIKLPFGLITKYDGSSATDINSGYLVLRFTSPSSQTITGYFRIWYTDA